MTRGPRTPVHRLGPDRLDPVAGLRVGIGHGGVVIGFRQDGEPVSVQLFRNRPTHVVTVCNGYTARLLAFRAAAVGAAVEVTDGAVTATADWRPLLDLPPDGAVTRVGPGDPVPAGTPVRPVLRCEGVAPDAATPWPGLAAWQTRVIVPTSVPPSTVAGLTAFDLVLLRRLAPDTVYPVQLAFDLPADVADYLPRLPDDVVVAVADGSATLIVLGLTPVELAVLGTPTG